MADQLELLMTYTVFHIGVYISLTAAVIAAIDSKFLSFMKEGIWWTIPVIAFAAAGMCGGIIASSIPEFADFGSFSKAKLGPLGFDSLEYRYWAHAEHACFWAGISSVLLRFLYKTFIKQKAIQQANSLGT